MKTYHKIQTVYLRDPETKFKTLLEGKYARDEFEFLANHEWLWTEKVDGTNIRIMWDGEPIVMGHGTTLPPQVRIGGKTDNAQLHSDLVQNLNTMFTPEVMAAGEFDGPVCLYGEGYGPGIQKGGGNYRDDKSFVLFDVKVGDWWLKRSDVEDIAWKLGIDFVPVVGKGTLAEMVEFVRGGVKSTWGDFISEGVVARPQVELFDRGGRRIITKLKHKDFNHD